MNIMRNIFRNDLPLDVKASDAFQLDIALERRKTFLKYINRAWLLLGVVTLASIPFFPNNRAEFTWLIAVTFPTYFLLRIVNISERTQLAGILFTLIVNFSIFGLFLVVVRELGPYQAFGTQATVWMLMGLAVLFAGALIDKWAAVLMAFINTILLIATRIILAPGSDPRPSVLVFWGMLALTIWLYEETVGRADLRFWNQLADRKKAEEKLLESEERFRSLSGAAFEGIMIHDQGIILNANQAFADLISYPNPDELIGKNGLDIMSLTPESRELIKARMASDVDERFEINVLKPDGSVFPAETQGKDITFKGRKLRVVAMRDITERKRFETQLQQTTARLDAIFTASPIGIVSYDLEGKVIAWNRAAEQIFDWKSEEVLGLYAPHIPPAMQPEFRDLHRRVINGETIRNLELRRQRKDTTPIDITLNAAPMYDPAGAITGEMAIIQDISESKRADEKIRQLSRAVEQSPVSIVITDKAGVIEYINPRFTQITGYTYQETLGQNPRILKTGYTRQEEYKQLWDTISSGKEWNGVFQNKKKNGELYWESAVISSISNELGEITHFVAVKEDITERRKSESELKRYAKNNALLYELSQKIQIDSDIDLIFDDIHHAVQNLIACDAFVIGLLDAADQEVEDVYLWDHDRRWPGERHPLGHGLTSFIISSGQPLLVNEWDESYSRMTHPTIFGEPEEETRSVLAVPLFETGGRCFGMMSAQSYSANAYSVEDEQILMTLTNPVSRAIENSQLIKNLRSTNVELSKAYDTTIEGWSRAMDLRDKETEGHTLRVTSLSLKLARAMSLPESERIQIRRGALLHDIGKIGVPDQILFKPGDLAKEEWDVIHQHPIYAYNLLSGINFLHSALDIPYCHHEKWDGSGYPRGLKGEQIPLAARIFAIVDVWDALTNARPYRPAWTPQKTLNHIKEQSGKHFDPHVVEAFLGLIDTGMLDG